MTLIYFRHDRINVSFAKQRKFPHIPVVANGIVSSVLPPQAARINMERMDIIKKAQKRFQVKYVDNSRVGAPVGHVYSVMVEELGIKNPDLQGFMNEFNEYIKIGGDGFACVKSPLDHLYSRTQSKLKSMLQEKIFTKVCHPFRM